ncbi:MAG: hypothetical protein IK038_06630 [Bacteroidaceae bacterium]|nr:hypothetical protein [Bacteroidaceae bacterium]
MTTIELSINIVISIAAGAASGYGVFKFLGKKWVENWFAKDLKLYEHKLDVLKAKDEIRFNFLHKERVDIIKKLYKQVFELNELSIYLIMPDEMQKIYKLNKDDLFQQSIMHSHKLQMYLLENTIYIPKILEDRIAGLCYSYDSAAKSLMKDGSEEHKKEIEQFNQEKIRPLLNDLRDEFRRLLGVEFYDEMIKETV